MNRKGRLDNQIIFVLTLVVVLSIIFFLIWGVSLVAPPLIGSLSEASTIINNDILLQETGTSLGNASIVANQISQGILGTVPFTIYTMSLALLFGFLAICYYVRTLKFLFFIWLGVIGGSIVVCMILSNSYLIASTDVTLATFYSTWGANDFLMRNLPYIATLIGIVSSLLLFVIMQREPEEEDTSL